MRLGRSSNRVGAIVELFGIVANNIKSRFSGKDDDQSYDMDCATGYLPEDFKPSPQKSGPIPSRRAPQS